MANNGMRSLGLPEAVVAAAELQLHRWRTDAIFSAYQPQIEALVDAGRWDVLADAFRQVLPFGTGGRRGAVGVGPNRMNLWTVGTSVEGHVRWLRARYPGQALSVVIASDTRRFDDAGGVGMPGVPNPVLGLTSVDFAVHAARIYARHGVVVWLPAAGSWVSTPELSFAIRRLGATGGLNLSASHNPPDDNGVKVYDHRGAQLVPPDDEALLTEVARVEDAHALDAQAAAPFLRTLPPEVHADYVRTVAALAMPGERRTKVVYTPLHGTGCVDAILAAAGFEVERLADQATPDGAFPTVPGHLPNPERPEALARAIARAEVTGATLVLATDPDADRIGCAVRRHDGTWRFLDGNQIAALVVSVAARPDGSGRTPLVIKTEVTSTLVARVAEAAGADVVGDLLVGFKYVAEALRALDEEGGWRGRSRESHRFAAGCEESHGVLVTEAIRDKDAAGGGLLLACLADEAASRGETLSEVLDGWAKRLGHVRTTQLNVAFPGATGQARMAERIAAWAADPPATLGGRPVLACVDHRDPAGRFGPIRSASDRASRTVLALSLGGLGDEGARVILRPSGTEPKLKVYLEQSGAPGAADDGAAAWAALCDDVTARLLG